MIESINPISYTIKEVCTKTNFGKTKLYEFINSGVLPAKKWGNRTIILASDLEAFISNLEDYSAKVGVKNV